MIIRLSRSKSDQFRQGADVIIAITFKPTCLVLAGERYFTALGDPTDCTLPVLRRLVSFKKGLIPSIHLATPERAKSSWTLSDLSFPIFPSTCMGLERHQPLVML